MKSRAEQRKDISGKSFDVCVIGGGATGAGCALDAQIRGLSALMLDAGDFAGATSSAATKIIHGGVRYLEEAIHDVDPKEYHVVVRALHERVRMLDNAPHLTRKLEFVVPSFHWLNAAYLDIGLKIYDWLAGAVRSRLWHDTLGTRRVTDYSIRRQPAASLTCEIAVIASKLPLAEDPLLDCMSRNCCDNPIPEADGGRLCRPKMNSCACSTTPGDMPTSPS
jgi:hypothetical protein